MKWNIKRWLAIGLGSKGAIVADESSMYEIPPYSVKVIDNIGAGDRPM